MPLSGGLFGNELQKISIVCQTLARITLSSSYTSYAALEICANALLDTLLSTVLLCYLILVTQPILLDT